MDLAEQKQLLEEGLDTAAQVFATTVPALDAVECDEPVRKGRQKWQGSGRVEVSVDDLDARLDEVQRRWDELGIGSELSVLDDGSEPGLFGRHGPVGVSAISRRPEGGRAAVDLGGSTGCGELP